MLKKSFKDKIIFENLFLDLDNSFSLYGKNGSGKTTLFEILSGEDIDFTGEIIDNYKTPEDYGYFLQFTESGFLTEKVIDEILFSNADRDKFLGMIHMFKLDEFIDKNPYSLSKSTQKLITLFITLSEEKKIYILDEPDSGLSVNNQIILARLLRDLSRKKQILIISHSKLFLKLLDFDVLHFEDKSIHKKCIEKFLHDNCQTEELVYLNKFYL
ncbi:MAG: AAA family ATPase [Candidatus Delongbacteria bacterium]|nr:AAA family ATPase [Candidatus Delongbacteria bacterium]MBN2834430.1 AAA family ATPase [Candidatus Delongbacteria bacterium]